MIDIVNNACDLLDTVGNTPLVRLAKLFPQEGVEVFAKLEFFNPTASVKDRIVRHIVAAAERSGRVEARAAPSSRTPPATPARRWR